MQTLESLKWKVVEAAHRHKKSPYWLLIVDADYREYIIWNVDSLPNEDFYTMHVHGLTIAVAYYPIQAIRQVKAVECSTMVPMQQGPMMIPGLAKALNKGAFDTAAYVFEALAPWGIGEWSEPEVKGSVVRSIRQGQLDVTCAVAALMDKLNLHSFNSTSLSGVFVWATPMHGQINADCVLTVYVRIMQTGTHVTATFSLWG